MNTTREDHKYISQTKVLLITGMHRSGTSLITNLLYKSGLNIGKKLIGAHTGNMHGHYEDYDFFNFHENILKRNGLNHLVQQPLTNESITSEDTNHAKQLIEQRNQYNLWGWKDPRTALFLDFWHAVYPDLNFIFVYRHPVDVVISLLKRGIKLDMSVLENQLVGFQSWYVYNQSIINFYKRYPEKSVIGNISGILSNFNRYIERVNEKFNCSLKPAKINEIYKKGELKETDISKEIIQIFDKLAPQAMSIYNELESISEFPATSKSNTGTISDKLKNFKNTIESLDNCSMLESNQSKQLMATIFAMIAPDTMVKSRYSIEKYLKEENATIENKLIDRNNLIKNLRNQSNNQIEKINQLQNRLNEKNGIIENIQKRNNNSQKRFEEMKNKYQDLNLRLNSFNNDHQKLQQQHQQQTANLTAVKDRLNSIEGSRAWRLVRKWYALKAFLRRDPRVAPPSENPSKQLPDTTQKTKPLNNKRAAHNPTILFISHQARRSGAPMLLLTFIKWFKQHGDMPFEILLKHGAGDLRAEFAALAPLKVWSEERPGQLKRYYQQRNIQLIYANTVDNGQIIAALAPILQCPVVCHVHELEWIMRHFVGWDNMQLVRQYSTQYVAGSHVVKQNLLDVLDVPTDKVTVVHEFLPPKAESITETNIREQLQISSEAIVVGACGTVEWRKGPDLFVQLVRDVQAHSPGRTVHFIWIGGEPAGRDIATLKHDAQRIGVAESIHFVGSKPNFRDYMAVFDIFVLTSREDPFPLVVLEAASLCKPILCFDGAGGAKEFVGDECGFVIPYLDTRQMAEKVVILAESPELRQQLGQQAAEAVKQYNISFAGPKLKQIIQKTHKETATRQPQVVFAFPDGLTLGGVTTLSIDLARHLTERNHAVSFIEHKHYYGNPTLDFNIPKEISVINCKNQSHPDKLNLDLNEFIDNYKMVLPATFIPNWSYGTFAACAKLASSYSNRMRVIGFAHADEPGYYEWLSYYQSMIHRFLAPNEEIASTLKSILPNRNKDVVCLPYAVETPDILDRHYSVNTDQPLVLLFMARIVQKQKRVFKLVELSELLDERNVNFELRIIGDGQDKPALLEKISKLNPSLQARIKLKDTIPPSELERTWLDSDILILVSEYEGLSLTLLGAMANGCVPVVTNVRGTNSVIDHTKNGFISEIDDLSNMANDIKFLDDNREKLREIGDAAHQTIKIKHSYENYINEFGLILEEIWQEPSRKWPAHRPLLHVRQPNNNVLNNKSLNGLSIQTIGQEIPYKKLVKAIGYKLIQKRGFQWFGGLTSMKDKY